MKSLFNIYHFIVKLIKCLFGLAFFAFAGTGVAWVVGHVDTPREIVEVPVRVEVPVEREQRAIKEIVKDVAPRFKLPPLLVAAIIERESGGQRDAIRYEPGQVERAKKAMKTRNPDQIRMAASSHCYMQIMGYHAPKYGLSWADLYDPETCVEVGMTILSDCMKRYKEKPKVEQAYWALACYNGSTKYADAVMERLGQLLLKQYLG